MALERVKDIAPSAKLLGFPGTIVESRLTPVDDPVDGANHVLSHKVGPHYAAKDAMEAAADLSVGDAIVPNQIDPDFTAYLADVFDHKPTLNGVEVTTFDSITARQIIESYGKSGQVVHYGMWTIPHLPPGRHFISPEAQRRANSKGMLGEVFPRHTLPHQIVFNDARIKNRGRTVFDFTPSEFDSVKNGSDKLWVKAAKWGLGGEGVKSIRYYDEMIAFYKQLVELGVDDGEILLEEHLPGKGGSFCVIKRVDGGVQFNHVTTQLSDEHGNRTGNIIYELGNASKDMQELIELSAATVSNSDLAPGFYTFDTIDDASGIPKINDPANRKTGSTPTAFQRMYLVNNLNLPPGETVTGMQRLYLNPQTHFSDVIKAFNQAGLTQWRDGRMVTFRQFINAYNRASFHLALTTTDGEKLPVIEDEVVKALISADIDNSPKPF